MVLTAGKTAMPLTRVEIIRSAAIAMMSSVPPSIPSASVAGVGQLDLDLEEMFSFL